LILLFTYLEKVTKFFLCKKQNNTTTIPSAAQRHPAVYIYPGLSSVL